MFFKRFTKYIENAFYLFVLKTCSFIFRTATRKGMYRFAHALGMLLFTVARKHRKTAFSGLKHAFNGSKTPAELKRLVAECFISMATSAAEMAFFLRKPGQVRESVCIEGAGHLREGLARGKGVVLVSAHFGNFPLMLARLCLEGYRTSVIMRPLKDDRIERMFIPEARRLGLTPIYSIPRPACVQQALKTLRKNELLFIPVDQNFGTGGVYVDFFNRQAATATGPVVFAERTGAAIIPCFIIRHPDNSHTIKIEPMVLLERGDDHGEFLRSSLQRITGIIERYIREYPQEWSWIHRRWKSRPRVKAAPEAMENAAE
jgi:Kdo2-lipid IVA lauroyltransferase/acyltransferase